MLCKCASKVQVNLKINAQVNVLASLPKTYLCWSKNFLAASPSITTEPILNFQTLYGNKDFGRFWAVLAPSLKVI